MNILVTGANGQLGHEMQICAKNSNHKFVFTDVAEGYEKLDITNLDAIREKVKETGLIPVETDNGCIGFEQSRLTLECRKLYKDSMTAEKFLDKDLLQWYGAKGGFHDVYVVEITNAYKK